MSKAQQKAQAQPDPSPTLRQALAGSGLGLTLCKGLTLQSLAQARKTRPDPTRTSLLIIDAIAAPQAYLGCSPLERRTNSPDGQRFRGKTNIDDQGAEGDTDVNIEVSESGGIPTESIVRTAISASTRPASTTTDIHTLTAMVLTYASLERPYRDTTGPYHHGAPSESHHVLRGFTPRHEPANVKLGLEDDVGEDVIGELHTTSTVSPEQYNTIAPDASAARLVVSSYCSDIGISAYYAGIYNGRHLHSPSYNIDRASEKPYTNPTGTLRPPRPGPLVLAIHLAARRLPEGQCLRHSCGTILTVLWSRTTGEGKTVSGAENVSGRYRIRGIYDSDGIKEPNEGFVNDGFHFLNPKVKIKLYPEDRHIGQF
ncbi:hypothetical protein EDD85DRAFT_936530 [Armillaria nabsnona]|nr:hypothetical protein EDD85DRAFT_936530 [Armillaria nabsnona]